MTIRVTVTDVASGDTETKEITDDVLVITEGRCEVTHVQSHANGTQVWTIKNTGGRP